jgi:hypothetical protein
VSKRVTHADLASLIRLVSMTTGYPARTVIRLWYSRLPGPDEQADETYPAPCLCCHPMTSHMSLLRCSEPECVCGEYLPRLDVDLATEA